MDDANNSLWSDLFGMPARILCSLFILTALMPLAEARPLLRTTRVEGRGCPSDAVCGVVMRPLDPSGHVKGEIPVAYRLYRHTDRNASTAGTIVTQEGGPGYPSIGSHYGYLRLFAPLRGDHDILMVDARGTGASAIHCASVQTEVRTPHDVGECGRSLGRASMLYGTRLAVEDMAAVLDALQIAQIDYYGDSYGTFFGQVFSALYPARLRSVVLDGAYPVIGETPWYSHAGDVVRRGFNLVCERSPYCASLNGPSLERIRGLVSEVRKHPISGRAPDGDGKMRNVTVDPGSVGNMLYDGAEGPVNYRDLDAAIRALHQHNDTLPLLRLIAENDADEDPEAPGAYSYGLFSAVSCMDYQQIYEMRSPPGVRREQRDRSLAEENRRHPEVYDPLSIAEFQTVPIDISVLNLCLRWPVKNPPYRPGKPIPHDTAFTDAPTLVINGELDMLTTAAEGAIVTKQYPNGRQIVVANSFHVDAIEDIDDCAQQIVRRFVRTLDPGDTSCAAQVKPVRMVPFFARRAADVVPATPEYGNTATRRELCLASAAVQTAADALIRWNINYTGNGVGLRGGRWNYQEDHLVAHFQLKDVLWTADLPVSGSVDWNEETGAIRTRLTFKDPRGGGAHIEANWEDHDRSAVATLSGNIGSHKIVAAMPAP